jgi:hypothetical protein
MRLKASKHGLNTTSDVFQNIRCFVQLLMFRFSQRSLQDGPKGLNRSPMPWGLAAGGKEI